MEGVTVFRPEGYFNFSGGLIFGLGVNFQVLNEKLGINLVPVRSDYSDTTEFVVYKGFIYSLYLFSRTPRIGCVTTTNPLPPGVSSKAYAEGSEYLDKARELMELLNTLK